MSEISNETRDLLALSLVPGLGPKLTAALLARFGSAAAVRRATADQLMGIPHIGAKLASQFVAALRTVDVDQELERLMASGVQVWALTDPRYPVALAKTDTAPPLIYFRGKIEPGDARAVAIVGSRQCTSYGRRMAERLAGDLARAGFTIVSGLARGIDGAAHFGALQAGGRTLAVLAGGLSQIYPPEHTDLAAQVEQSGALISETPMTVDPQPGMFPARNRIISGLSLGVIIIEAGEKSGALITARHAAEQGREVFALPANVDSEASRGTLRLLRDGARLVRHADDVLEDLAALTPIRSSEPGKETPPSPAAPPAAVVPPNLDPVQQQVWDLLSEGPRPVDDLVRAVGLPVAQLTGMLMVLEMKKVVRRLPGNLYERRV